MTLICTLVNDIINAAIHVCAERELHRKIPAHASKEVTAVTFRSTTTSKLDCGFEDLIGEKQFEPNAPRFIRASRTVRDRPDWSVVSPQPTDSPTFSYKGPSS